MAQTIKIKRGIHSALPTSGMSAGEPLVTTDRGNLYLATGATEKVAVTPAIDILATLASISSAEDLIIMHDADATGQKEKKITFQNFKAALNIPDASSDEKVAIASGATSGYLWGTTGADGVLRMGPSLAWVKDASNNFVTIDVAVVDGGTF